VRRRASVARGRARHSRLPRRRCGRLRMRAARRRLARRRPADSRTPVLGRGCPRTPPLHRLRCCQAWHSPRLIRVWVGLLGRLVGLANSRQRRRLPRPARPRPWMRETPACNFMNRAAPQMRPCPWRSESERGSGRVPCSVGLCSAGAARVGARAGRRSCTRRYV